MYIPSANSIGGTSAKVQANYLSTDKKSTSQKQIEPALTTASQTTSSTASSATAPSPNSSHSSVVNISNAGKAALQEATETVAQTKTEAINGDRQAQRQLAKSDGHKK